MGKIIIGLCAVLFLGVGTTALASQALPGDLLYGVKLSVNERVEGALKGGGSARAEWQIELAERRLQEAAEAAIDGQLSSNAQATVLVNFNAQMQGIEQHIIKLREEGRNEEAKEFAIAVGQALAGKTETLAYAQTEAHASVDSETQGSLDFLVLRVGNAIAAAASIAVQNSTEEGPQTLEEMGPAIDEAQIEAQMQQQK